MNKLLKYLPFHFLLALIVGVCIQFFTNFWMFGFQKLGIILILLLLSLALLHFYKKRIVFTFFCWISFVFIGIISVYIHDTRNYTNYYKNVVNKNSVVIIKIKKVLKPSNYYNKYKAEVIQIDTIKTRGKIILNVLKDSINKLQIDHQFLLKPVFVDINAPLNPHQFNYKKYLEKQQVYSQVFVENYKLKKLQVTSFSLVGLASKFRIKIQNKLKEYHFSKNEFAVINALLLGQRQDISKELLEEYSQAGAIHILAVSGLHVGIILLLLIAFFKPLERLKYGVYLKTFLIVLLLWGFAFIAGLSASVVRAVTMFTFVAVGQSLQRNKVIEHSLVTSMFVLLLIQPMFLFNVGFQLSYLAVFGIVWIQPKLYKLWQPKLNIIDKIWQLSTVSIAAQIGILPLSLFYFHQFPGLFLVSNLVIIPFLSGILSGGILVIGLALFNILPQFLANFYEAIIWLLNKFVGYISYQETFLFQNVSMSFLEMISWYIFLIVGLQFFIYKKAKQLPYVLIAILLVQSVFIFEKKQRNVKEELIVFHKNRKSIIGNRVGKELTLFTDLDSESISKEQLITSYNIGENTQLKGYRKLSSVFNINRDKILLIDSLGVYHIPVLKESIVLLQYSPKINLKRMITTLQPKKIIADGTNYKSYIYHWQKTCKQEKTPFHYTGKNGAFILFDK